MQFFCQTAFNVSIYFISISHRLAIKQDWSNDMRKHSRRNRYFSGEIESERDQIICYTEFEGWKREGLIICYTEFEEWEREGLTLYLVACAGRVLKQYGILGDMDWCGKFFYCRNYWFELSPDGWLLTGTIWIWRVPRVKGYGSIDMSWWNPRWGAPNRNMGV